MGHQVTGILTGRRITADQGDDKGQLSEKSDPESMHDEQDQDSKKNRVKKGDTGEVHNG